MKKILAAAILATFFLVACDKDEDDNDTNTTDRSFVMMTAMGNTAEIGAGQVAAGKATNAGVKSFGQMMVDEHGLAQTELKSIAASLGLRAPDSIDAEHVSLMAKLDTLSGYNFDTAYIRSQVKDHQKTIDMFQSEINSGKNQSIKAYASKYLPHIQMHFQKADSILQAID